VTDVSEQAMFRSVTVQKFIQSMLLNKCRIN